MAVNMWPEICKLFFICKSKGANLYTLQHLLCRIYFLKFKSHHWLDLQIFLCIYV